MPSIRTPRTLALIPDGNRRWAKGHKLMLLDGYNTGVNKFISFSEWCIEYGINNVAVWAFSTENFSRDSHEKKALFRIYKKFAEDSSVLERLRKNKTSIKVIGNTGQLPVDLRKALSKLEDNTKMYKEHVINILIGYGGKNDILHAVKNMLINVKNKAMINEKMFERYLISSALPAVDLVIRTSGEYRLSGFMPWQTEYSELYFSKKLWPDFTKKDLHKALLDYSKRQRRFGK